MRNLEETMTLVLDYLASALLDLGKKKELVRAVQRCEGHVLDQAIAYGSIRLMKYIHDTSSCIHSRYKAAQGINKASTPYIAESGLLGILSQDASMADKAMLYGERLGQIQDTASKHEINRVTHIISDALSGCLPHEAADASIAVYELTGNDSYLESAQYYVAQIKDELLRALGYMHLSLRSGNIHHVNNCIGLIDFSADSMRDNYDIIQTIGDGLLSTEKSSLIKTVLASFRYHNVKMSCDSRSRLAEKWLTLGKQRKARSIMAGLPLFYQIPLATKIIAQLGTEQDFLPVTRWKQQKARQDYFSHPDTGFEGFLEVHYWAQMLMLENIDPVYFANNSNLSRNEKLQALLLAAARNDLRTQMLDGAREIVSDYPAIDQARVSSRILMLSRKRSDLDAAVDSYMAAMREGQNSSCSILLGIIEGAHVLHAKQKKR